MIFTKVFTFVLSCLTDFLGLFPTADPHSWGSDVSGLTHWSSFAGVFFPIETVLAALAVLVAWSLMLSTLRLFIWLLTLIHVAGGSG